MRKRKQKVDQMKENKTNMTIDDDDDYKKRLEI